MGRIGSECRHDNIRTEIVNYAVEHSYEEKDKLMKTCVEKKYRKESYKKTTGRDGEFGTEFEAYISCKVYKFSVGVYRKVGTDAKLCSNFYEDETSLIHFESPEQYIILT